MQDKTLDGVTFISTTPITTEPMARCCGNALNGATFISTYLREYVPATAENIVATP